MNKKLIDWWTGGASFTSEYRAVLDRATALGYTLPDDATKTKQNALVVALKSAGIWSSLDLFYVFHTNDASFALINWISPSVYQCTRTQLTFTASSGFKGNGSTGYLDTGFSLKTNGVNYGLNNNSAFCYVPETTTVGATVFGCNDAAGANVVALTNYSAGNASFYLQSAFGDNIAVSNQGGFMLAQRTASATSKLFKNGASIGNGTRTSSNSPTPSIWIGARNNNGAAVGAIANTTTISCFGIGSSLSGLESSLSSAWTTYIS